MTRNTLDESTWVRRLHEIAAERIEQSNALIDELEDLEELAPGAASALVSVADVRGDRSMKVWIVLKREPYEGDEVAQVFASRERAERFIATRDYKAGDGYLYRIQEWKARGA